MDASDKPRAAVVVSDCGQLCLDGSRNESEKIDAATVAPARVEEVLPSDSEDSYTSGHNEDLQEPEEQSLEEQMAGMSDIEKRLFLIRLRMNKGRKENRTAVDEEYKKMADPNYEKKQRAKELSEKKRSTNASGRQGEDPFLTETAAAAAAKMEKMEQKKKNASTFGWQAFTQEADYNAYKKRLAALPRGSQDGPAGDFDPMQYGKVANDISTDGKRRVVADIEDREKKREKYSRRRNDFNTSVGGINDKNEVFNKKIKRSFDKYTVEIRQNLERGTAL